MKRLLLGLTACLWMTPAQAQLAPPIPDSPEIVIATSTALAPALRSATAAFMARNPAIRVRIVAQGSDVAMAYLSSGRADIAILGRDASEPEAKAYQWVFRHPATVTPLLRGSVSTAGYSPDLAVRVHASSSISALSFDQLRATLATGKARLVIPDTESGTGSYLRTMLRDGAPQLEWRRVTEVRARSDAATGAAIARAVAKDRNAIGFGDARPLAGTRIVPIAGALPGDAHYPLARTVRAYADPSPRPGAARLLAFLQGEGNAELIVGRPWRRLP